MTLKIASWNIEGRLSAFSTKGRGTPIRIVAEIRQLDADIILLIEAYDKTRGVAPGVEEVLEALGYVVHDVPYDDAGPERVNPALSIPVMRLMSRVPIEEVKRIRLGDLRNALVVIAVDPHTKQPFRFVGVHLDDRAEELRLRQLADLVPIITHSTLPTVMMGDYNAMYGHGRVATLLKNWFVRVLVNYIPTTSLRDFAKRAVGMATGTTMETLLSETDLRDVDPHHHPTTTPKVRQHEWLPSIRLIDLDHLLVSGDVAAHDFTIASRDGGSDHRSISAFIEVAAVLQK